MRCYALSLGARNTRAAGRRFSAKDDALIRSITRKHFPTGFTIVEATGGWWDGAQRRFIREASRQIQINSASPGAVRRWARDLGAALGQSELMVVALGAPMLLKMHTRRRQRGRAPQK